MNAINIVPPMLAPLRILRNGEVFRNLSNHNFSEEEIVWLCRNIKMSNGMPDPAVVWASRYGLSLQHVFCWLQAYDMDEPPFETSDDSPFDSISLEVICNWKNEGGENKAELMLLIEQQLDATQNRCLLHLPRRSYR
jgi:hypothetical protein